MGKDRLKYFDLARGFAIWFMLMVHVVGELATQEINLSVFGKTVEFLGGPPAAPVFMFLMGVFIALSKNFNLSSGIHRGLKVFLLGYLLNFLRGTLPVFLGLKLNLFSLDVVAPYTPSSLFWIVDILQFAGLALVFLSILRHFVCQRWVYIALAIAITIVSPLLWGRVPDMPVLNQAFTLLWGVGGEAVAFPLFPWLVFPLGGIVYGNIFKQTPDKSRFFRRSLLVGSLFLLAGTFIILTDFDFHVGDYYRSGPGGVLWICGFVMFVLWFCRVLVNFFGQNKVFSILYYWSSHITAFYFIHWILIGWFPFEEIDSVLVAICVMLIVAVLTDLFTRGWIKGHKLLRQRTK